MNSNGEVPNPARIKEGVGNKPVKETSSNKFLILCAVAANMAAVGGGAVIAWSSPVQADIDGNNSPLNVTEEQASWVTGVAPLCAVLGPFGAGYVADKFGRRKSLLLVSVPLAASWIILAITKMLALVYLARVLAGLSLGWIFTILPMYIGEISTDEVRGALGSFFQIFLTLGILYIYAVGPYVSWLWLQMAGLITSIIQFFVMFWLPESPYFYAIKHDKTSGINALQSLRRKSVRSVEREYNSIKEEVEESFKTSTSVTDLWASRANIKALVISLGLVGFQNLAGIDVIEMYTESIFAQAAGNADNALSPEVSTIIIGSAELISSLFTPFFIDRIGRRFLLLVSAILMGIAHIVLGTYFHLQENGQDLSSISFVPVLCVIFFTLAFSIGFGSVVWAVVGEIFAPNIKSLAATLCASFSWLIAFLIIQFYPRLRKSIGADGSFWMFGGLCVAAFVFTFFLLPETKGKSMVEIQDILNK